MWIEQGKQLFARLSLYPGKPEKRCDIKNGATYTGVTNDIKRRIVQHRERAGSAHAKKYDIYRLVYIELHEDMSSAITREKRVKKWLRAWKIALIEKDNTTWRDLWFDLNR